MFKMETESLPLQEVPADSSQPSLLPEALGQISLWEGDTEGQQGLAQGSAEAAAGTAVGALLPSRAWEQLLLLLPGCHSAFLTVSWAWKRDCSVGSGRASPWTHPFRFDSDSC